MAHYHNFIGIDIGKSSFVVNVYSEKEIIEYDYNAEGIRHFLSDHKKILPKSLCILETTGGFELDLLYTLCQHEYRVHRTDNRKVKNFIRSFGNAAKTDALDAKALAKYGHERHQELEIFTPQSNKSLMLYSLVQRRKDLTDMMVAEKNRLKSPGSKNIRASCQSMVAHLQEEIKQITATITELIDEDPVFKKKQRILLSVPGIGPITAFQLIVLLPELGKINRKKIASLAGLAPIANESGHFKGYRRTGHGRNGIKPILFLCAMAARNSKSELKAHYDKLIQKGKKKMVALTALMRKILVIANARLKALEV